MVLIAVRVTASAGCRVDTSGPLARWTPTIHAATLIHSPTLGANVHRDLGIFVVFGLFKLPAVSTIKTRSHLCAAPLPSGWVGVPAEFALCLLLTHVRLALGFCLPRALPSAGTGRVAAFVFRVRVVDFLGVHLVQFG